MNLRNKKYRNVTHLLENKEIFISLGTNLGDRIHQLEIARDLIEQLAGKIITQSSIYETAAWGLTNQGAFLNQVIEISSTITPAQLMKQLLMIEEKMGRKREVKWGPRLIDLDILYFSTKIVSTENLQIPHSFLHERHFVLVPLTEISPNFIHPLLKKSNTQLLNECKDTSEVHKFQ